MKITSKDSGLDMGEFIRCKKFRVGELEFIWFNEKNSPKQLVVTGGFIDSEKIFGIQVNNPEQLLVAIATKGKVVANCGTNPNDRIEIEFDFSEEDVSILYED